MLDATRSRDSGRRSRTEIEIHPRYSPRQEKVKKFFDNYSSHCIRFFRSQIISLEEIDSDESSPFHLITAVRNEGNSTDLCWTRPIADTHGFAFTCKCADQFADT